MKVLPWTTASMRGALIAGFTVIFALWLASAYEFLRTVREGQEHSASAQEAFARGEIVLTGVTTRVLLGSIYLRDALMHPTSEMRESVRNDLQRIRAEVDQLLPNYVALVDTPQEHEQWNRLQHELDEYWSSREVAFTTASQGDQATVDAAIIRTRLVPARQSILHIVDSLSALERASVASHRAEVDQLYRNAQQRVVWLTTLALIAALATALIATRHVGALEREIERQRRADRQNRRDLEQLSAKLVTAQEEERRSLARELHDAVGQALTAIKVEMGVAVRDLVADSRARAALNQARAIAESTLQSVRDLSQLLHPSMLDDFGLPEAIEAYLRSFSRRSRIRAQLTHERMSDRLPAEVEVCAYRIVQEALTNIARHSGASSCTVSLIRRGDMLHLSIEDDGRGISVAPRAADSRRGLGLIGMRERAQALAGTFVIENRPEGGTRVAVKLPVPAVERPVTEQLAG